MIKDKIRAYLADLPDGASTTVAEMSEALDASARHVRDVVAILVSDGQAERYGAAVRRASGAPESAPDVRAPDVGTDDDSAGDEPLDPLARIVALSEEIGRLVAARDAFLRQLRGGD